MSHRDLQKKQEYDKKYHQGHREEKKEYDKEYYQKHKKEKIEYAKKYRQENKELLREKRKLYKEEKKAYSKKYFQENKKSCIERNRQWNRENPDKVKITQKKSSRKRYSTSKGKLDNSMSTAIYLALKGNKSGRKWEDLVGYTVEDLIKHLEKQFKHWMNWDNYGIYEEGKFKWHVDHRKPQCLFNYEKSEDEEFKKCWALENLQPLEAIANIKKSNNY